MSIPIIMNTKHMSNKKNGNNTLTFISPNGKIYKKVNRKRGITIINTDYQGLINHYVHAMEQTQTHKQYIRGMCHVLPSRLSEIQPFGVSSIPSTGLLFRVQVMEGPLLQQHTTIRIMHIPALDPIFYNSKLKPATELFCSVLSQCKSTIRANDEQLGRMVCLGKHQVGSSWHVC
jgi:hypothetical protein